MRLKDLGEDCELCPVLKAELCTGGFTCYGGQPIHDLDESGWSNKRVDAMQHLKAAKEILEHEGE